MPLNIIKLSSIVIFLYVNSGLCYRKTTQIPAYRYTDGPLFLTPLIKSGKIREAQQLAKVGPLEGAGSITSYSGFLTVNKAYNSNLFFWFFPVGRHYPDAPVVLWLEGGPGVTSMYGLFVENGPFSINEKYVLKQREFSWTRDMNVIYIDNPVGTGYSFTGSDAGYARNETIIGEDLYQAIFQFFQLFPTLQKNEFYVVGESYGGKFAVALSYTIHTKYQEAKRKMNFKGVAIGNGWCDPEHMLRYGDYLYQIGLIDNNTRKKFQEQESLAVKYIQEKKWDEAYDVVVDLMYGDESKPSLFFNATGFTYTFNYLKAEVNETDVTGEYVQLADVRRATHVDNATFYADVKVAQMLKQDTMQSVKPWVEVLLNNNYKVLIYNGQLDIEIAYSYTLGFLQSLEWTGAESYKTATRVKWLVDGEIAGYATSVGNFTEVLVRNAGHLVTVDQPKWAFDLINRFTSNKPFNSLNVISPGK